jgi:hypothetical protein
MQLSPKLLLILIPSSIGFGIFARSTDRQLATDRAMPSQPTLWKIQPIEPPSIVRLSAHQAFLSRQNQSTNRNFSCDCNGCRVAAARVGIDIN